MSDEPNPFDSLLNKSVPDKPGKPAPPPPPVPDNGPADGGPPPDVRPEAPPTQTPSYGPPGATPYEPPGAMPYEATPPAVASLEDLRSPVAEFEQVADEMRRYADGLKSALTSAADRTYEVTSDDGSFTVTVDGRPRVRGIRIDPRAMRKDPADLAAKIMLVLNEAVRVSRQEGYEELMGELDPASRSMVRDGTADARRIVPEEEP
jgi:DNA-binding protein YbaB